MWPPSLTFFGLLFLISSSPLQAQEAEKALVEEETNALGPETHLLTNPAPSLGEGMVEKFLTARSNDGEVEREGREVGLTTATTKEGSIISDVSSYKTRISIRFYEHFLSLSISLCPRLDM